MPNIRRYDVVVAPRVIRELADIHADVAARSPEGAASLIDRINGVVNGLSTFPLRYGRAVEAKGRRRDLRQAVV
jgi:hypothetical protein